jgi:hypothetical protein
MSNVSNTAPPPMSTGNWTDHHRISRDHDDSAGCIQAGRARTVIATRIMPLLGALMAVLSLTAVARPAAAEGEEDITQRRYRQIIADPAFGRNVAGYRKQYPFFDWTTDGCTVPKQINAKAFYVPCVQHDFGYRNNRLVGLHNEETRRFVDQQLGKRMAAICNRQADPKLKNTCLTGVGAAFAAVRSVGGRWW